MLTTLAHVPQRCLRRNPDGRKHRFWRCIERKRRTLERSRRYLMPNRVDTWTRLALFGGSAVIGTIDACDVRVPLTN